MADQIIKINTGAVTYQIQDADGEVLGKVKFTPTDTGLLSRVDEIEKFFNELEVADNPTNEQIIELDETIKAQFDYVLGRPVSADLFGIVQPLTPLEDGSFFFMSVFDGVADAIKNAFEDRAAAKAARVEAAVKSIEAETSDATED